MTPALILCALKRHRGPLSTIEVCDIATGLAVSANWPASRVANDPVQIEAMLRRLERERMAQRIDSSSAGIQWASVASFDPAAPVPDPPPCEPEFTLPKLDQRQWMVLIDILGGTLAFQEEQRRARADLDQKQAVEWAAVASHARHQLLSAGIPQDVVG